MLKHSCETAYTILVLEMGLFLEELFDGVFSIICFQIWMNTTSWTPIHRSEGWFHQDRTEYHKQWSALLFPPKEQQSLFLTEPNLIIKKKTENFKKHTVHVQKHFKNTSSVAILSIIIMKVLDVVLYSTPAFFIYTFVMYHTSVGSRTVLKVC